MSPAQPLAPLKPGGPPPVPGKGAPLLTVQDLKVYFEVGGNSLLRRPPGVD